MARISINYSYDKDETTICLSPEFESLPDIHQLDALRDALYELERVYDAKLTRFNRQGPLLVNDGRRGG